MFNIFVDCPNGDQQVIPIDETGGYFDPTKILWDERTQGALPEITVGKMYIENGQLVTGTDYTPAYQAYLNSLQQLVVSSNIADLWNAADRYIYSHINGIGYGLLALGVMSAKPKAIAVAAWVDSVWTECQKRQLAVTPGSAINIDFSSFEPMPFTVWELRDEVSNLWGGA